MFLQLAMKVFKVEEMHLSTERQDNFGPIHSRISLAIVIIKIIHFGRHSEVDAPYKPYTKVR